MKKITFNQILYALFLIGVFLAGLSVGVLRPQPSLNQPIVSQDTIAKPLSVMIDRGDGLIKVQTDIAWQEGMTVFDALKTASEKQNIKLEYKDYGGDLEIFIESIDGKKGSGDVWWQYWINNKYGEVGSSGAKVSAGDAIMWKLVKGQMK